MSIEVEKFLEVIKDCKTKTPETVEFEKNHGQTNKDWWNHVKPKDEYFRNQKYHIYLYFFCRACHNGSLNKECDKKCEECYKNKLDRFTNKDVSKSNLKDNFLQTKYNKMGRPEMYLWFVEAFGLLEGKKLEAFVSDITDLCPKHQPVSMKEIRDCLNDTYKINWDTVAERANEIADEMGI